MKIRIIGLLVMMAVGFTACVLESANSSTTGEEPPVAQVIEVTAAAPAPEPGPVCPAPVEGEPPADCAPLLRCTCSCNGVTVTIELDPTRHGETCSSLNGRPCNTDGTGPFKYQGCR